jgi:hypothetical protein
MEEGVAAVTLQISWPWVKSTALLAVVIFASTFLVQAGTVGVASWNESSLHAAIIAAVAAVVSFLQSALANLITPASKPPAVIVPSAVTSRRLAA